MRHIKITYILPILLIGFISSVFKMTFIVYPAATSAI